MYNFWLILDRVTIVIALMASLYSAFSWWLHHRREKQLQTPVPVRLISAEDGRLLYELPFQPPRRLVTRAEILGLLGMIPSTVEGQRFEWAWLHEQQFMHDLQAIHQAKMHRLEIPLTATELTQVMLSPAPSP